MMFVHIRSGNYALAMNLQNFPFKCYCYALLSRVQQFYLVQTLNLQMLFVLRAVSRDPFAYHCVN